MRLLIAVFLFIFVAARGQIITTVAGTGLAGYSGDGGLAINAEFRNPKDLCTDMMGNLYVITNGRIRKINLTTGYISAFAGNGGVESFPAGDGGNALNTPVHPTSLFSDKAGNIYFVDNAYTSIRKVDNVTGIISRVAGTQYPLGPIGDGLLAVDTWLAGLEDACIDNSGNFYILTGGYNCKLRKVGAATGIINTIAGTGTYAFAGDNGPAITASFKYALRTCVDPNNNIYVADTYSFRIRRIDAVTGIITTIAGTGVEGNTGDGGLAVNARIGAPDCIRTDAAGNIFFSNIFFNTIRKIDISTGIITTVAGNGIQGSSPDGTPATTAMLNQPIGIYIDAKGDLYFTEYLGHKVRKIAAVGAVVCTPAVTISTSTSTICSGQSTTFNSSSVNGGVSPSFEWYKNGAILGTATSYTATTLNNNDVINCKLISNAVCAIQTSVVSNNITMTVNPAVSPSVTIAAATQTICAASSGVFTATAVNAGNSVSYQWKINQINAGSDTPIFLTTSLNNSDLVSCMITTNNICAVTNNASSNTITMTVNPLISPSVAIASDINPVCEGTKVNFTAAPLNGGQSPQYIWKINGNDIPNTNAGTFSYNNFKDKDVVTCLLNSNAGCLVNASSISNSITLSVISMPTITIQASSTILCKGAEVNFTANGTNLGAVPTYQWKVNGSNSGNGSNIFSTGTLSNRDKITCTLKAGTVCNTPIASNEISVMVNGLPTIKIDSIQIIVKGHSVQFSPVVSSDVIAYQWTPSNYLNKDNIANPVASPISTLTYRVLVSTRENCEADANVKVIVLDKVNAPNVFSPNGDGINDTWQIPGLSSYPGCTVNIYNRGGQLVYQSIGYDKPWDGSLNGKGVPIGTYYYIINPKNGFGQVTGSVTVIR